MSKNFIDRFYEEDIKDQFWSLNKKIGAGLIVLFLAVIMINTTGCTQNNTEEAAVEDPLSSPIEAPKDTVKVGDDGVNAAIAPDDVSIVADQKAKNDTMVAMSVEDLGRSDPFLPEKDRIANVKPKPKPKPKYYNDLLPPPESISVDYSATQVMATKVSGIMFDKYNPSAILNINGSDYLVRSGDVVNGYKILSITTDTVTVQFGSNVYKARVGQLFTGNGVIYNSVSNLENKFGSRNNNSLKN